MICGVSSYAIDRANQGLVTIRVVVADVEFQNIMTAKEISATNNMSIVKKYRRSICGQL
jgi:RNase P subunit RPR2